MKLEKYLKTKVKEANAYYGDYGLSLEEAGNKYSATKKVADAKKALADYYELINLVNQLQAGDMESTHYTCRS